MKKQSIKKSKDSQIEQNDNFSDEDKKQLFVKSRSKQLKINDVKENDIKENVVEENDVKENSMKENDVKENVVEENDIKKEGLINNKCITKIIKIPSQIKMNEISINIIKNIKDSEPLILEKIYDYRFIFSIFFTKDLNFIQNVIFKSLNHIIYINFDGNIFNFVIEQIYEKCCDEIKYVIKLLDSKKEHIENILINLHSLSNFYCLEYINNNNIFVDLMNAKSKCTFVNFNLFETIDDQDAYDYIIDWLFSLKNTKCNNTFMFTFYNLPLFAIINRETNCLNLYYDDNKIDIVLWFLNNPKLNNYDEIIFIGNNIKLSKKNIQEIKHVMHEPNTSKTYESRIRLLEKIKINLNNTTVDEIIMKLDNYRKDSNLMPYAINTMHSFFAAINDYLKTNNTNNKKFIEDVYNKMMYYRNTADKKNQQNQLGEREDFIEWDDILNKHQELSNIKNNSFSDYTNYLILSLYCMEAPRRNDYGGMKIVNKIEEAIDIEHNYYARIDKTFIFNKYKTSKKKQKLDPNSIFLKSQNFVTSDELADIIETYINHVGNKNLNILLSNKQFVSKRLVNILNCNKPINTLRHSIITHYNANMNVDERIKLAENMSHSVMMQLYYVKKFSK